MKNLLLIAALVAPALLFSQTEEIEKAYLNSLIAEGKATTTEMAQMGKAWRDLLAEFGGYPTLPYNEQTGKIEFVQVMEFPGKSKETIIQRIEEWVAIHYGSIEAVLHYKNYETGKLIVKGYFEIPFELGEYDNWYMPDRVIFDAKCYHTVVFTIKNGKFKVEFQDMKFSYRTKGYISSTTYIPSESYEIRMDGLYPVTRGDRNTWKSRLRTIQNVEEEITAQKKNLTEYIQKADDYNNF